MKKQKNSLKIFDGKMSLLETILNEQKNRKNFICSWLLVYSYMKIHFMLFSGFKTLRHFINFSQNYLRLVKRNKSPNNHFHLVENVTYMRWLWKESNRKQLHRPSCCFCLIFHEIFPYFGYTDYKFLTHFISHEILKKIHIKMYLLIFGSIPRFTRHLVR